MKNKIYRTNLIVLQDNKSNLSIEDLSYLPSREAIVEDLGNGFYREIYTGKVFPAIIPHSLAPFYTDDAYIVMPNELSDRVDNTQEGMDYIKNYVSKSHLYKKIYNSDIESFINMSKNLNKEELLKLKDSFDSMEEGTQIYVRSLKQKNS